MRKALVTGGAGFIGSHLVERLVREGCQVVVLDNLSNGREENLVHLRNDHRLILVRVDIADYAAIHEHFQNVDTVFHLAALADIVPSIERPLHYHRANVDGTVAVLEASRKAGVKRFIYAGSSSCYGIPDVYPTPETASIRPQYPYALTKYLGEQCVLHWHHAYKLPVVSLRLFNVYGPRSRTSGTYGAVFGVFLAQKLAGQPFTVVGDGTQTRDFVYVTDVVEAMLMAARSSLSGEILNVGSGRPQSINYLVGLLQGDVTHVSKRPGEPDCTHADISKIKRLLGWQPRISFEKGIEAMLHNISYWKDAPVWTRETIEVATREWFAHLNSGL